MKKNLYTLLLSTVLYCGMMAQSPPQWEWVRTFATSRYAEKITHDIMGNVYVTGGYLGGLTIAQTTFSNAGAYDFFLAKYDPSGNLVWMTTGGSAGDDLGYGVSVDIFGNAVISGYFTGNHLVIGNTTLTTGYLNLTTPFIAKYNSAGSLLWAKAAQGNTLFVDNEGIVMDVIGNTYIICNTLGGSYKFDSVVVNPGAYQSASLIRFDVNGTAKWSKTLHCNRQTTMRDLSVDYSGNVYVGGYFDGDTLYADTARAINKKKFLEDGFLTKIDSSGDVQWLKSLSGPENEFIMSCTNDLSGNTFLCGAIQSSLATFNSQTVNNAHPGFDEIFLAKLDPAGQTLWTKIIGGSNYDDAVAVSCDVKGSVYLGAVFQSSIVTVGSYTFINPGGGYWGADILLLKYRADGALVWAKKTGNTNDELVQTVTADVAGNCYVAGHYATPFVMFDTIPVNNPGYWSLFVAKIPASNYNLNTDITESFATDEVFIYPNPVSGQLFIAGTETDCPVTIKDIYGKAVLTSNYSLKGIDISPLPAGIYFAEINRKGGSFIKKLVKT